MGSYFEIHKNSLVLKRVDDQINHTLHKFVVENNKKQQKNKGWKKKKMEKRFLVSSQNLMIGKNMGKKLGSSMCNTFHSFRSFRSYRSFRVGDSIFLFQKKKIMTSSSMGLCRAMTSSLHVRTK